MPESKKTASPRPASFRPEQALRLFSPQGRKPESWPAWILIRWEESFLFRRFLQQLWDTILSADPSAERVVLYPKEPAAVKTFFEEVSASSLFSSTRLVIAHLARPVKRIIRLEDLGHELLSIPERTIVVMAVEGMAKLDDEMALLAKPMSGGARSGFEIAIWKPFDRNAYLAVAREILATCGVRTDDLTLNFWLERIGSNLDRLQAEARRLKMQFADGEATQERLEEIFEVPHVHDETVWDVLRLILNADAPKASDALTRLLQSSDVFLVATELSRTLLCVRALSDAASAGRATAPADVFFQFDVKGKRRQEKMMGLASLLDSSACSTPDLASRLLSLDLAIKQAKTVSGRQEVLLRTLLALCGEPQPAA